jgi:GAF domain-containing protein
MSALRRDDLRGLAAEQAALRRVATLVGEGSAPEAIFGAVSDEVRRLVDIDVTSMFRCESHDTLTLLAVQSADGPVLEEVIGRRIPMGTAFAQMLDGGVARRLNAEQVAQWIADVPEARSLQLRASIGCPIVVGGRPWGAMFASARTADRLMPDAEAPFQRLTELMAIAIAHAQARSDLSKLAEEQAALRRVATLVVRGASPDEIFRTVTAEVAPVVGADIGGLGRLVPGGGEVLVAMWSSDGQVLPAGTPRPLTPGIDEALAAGLPFRFTPPDPAPPGSLAERVRALGGEYVIGTPIVVDGRPWGSIFAITRRPEPFPAGAEERMREFTELVATALSAAAARAELAASNERLVESRARVVAAADDERARVVRDLHDGAQQRLVHALIVLKLARRALDDDPARAAELIDDALAQADRAHVELRELAHGIMPSVLSHGGLAAGVRSLVSSLPIPVAVDVQRDRLAAHIEASAYFIVAEALTNVLKHAQADEARVHAACESDVLVLEVSDDGRGGAGLTGGTGLLGLQDRAVALGGELEVVSPPGEGTMVRARLPLG